MPNRHIHLQRFVYILRDYIFAPNTITKHFLGHIQSVKVDGSVLKPGNNPGIMLLLSRTRTVLLQEHVG